MIKRKTVLILGAGSSRSYGFPLGIELSKKILLASNITNLQELENLKLSLPQLQKFKEDFKTSGVSSIDEFLSTRINYIDIGKKLIAKVLLPLEATYNLFDNFDNRIEDNWYKYLLNCMLPPTLDQFHQNNISFVTFNYDRSLENFLFISLKSRFGASDKEVAEQLNMIKFIHPHGQLGFLPWQNTGSNEPIIEYDGEETPYKIVHSSKCIKIIHEANEESQEFSFASNLLSEADEIFFLGFGYHKDNLRRLRLPQRGSKTVAGTAKELGKIGILDAVKNSKSIFSEIELKPVSITEFFKEHYRLQ